MRLATHDENDSGQLAARHFINTRSAYGLPNKPQHIKLSFKLTPMRLLWCACCVYGAHTKYAVLAAEAPAVAQRP